jgi:hypothetical protein
VAFLEPTDTDAAAADAARLALLEARCARLEELLSGFTEESASFRLVNGAGSVVTEVHTDAEGATLRLLDPDGEPSGVVSVEAGGSALTLLNGAGCVVGAVVLNPSEGRVVVRHPDGNPAVIVESTQPSGGLEVRTLHDAVPAARVSVLDTGGGLEPAPQPEVEKPALAAKLRHERGLNTYSRTGRKAVALYAEGARGAVRVYDQAGACVFSQD